MRRPSATLAVVSPERIVTEFVDAGGMHFEVHTCGDPESDHLALLLHGFPEHAYAWRHQLPLFARHGLLAWAPNQRGYGRTTRPARVDDYRIGRLVDDVGALIDASGKTRVTLVGHDWGGLVAWAAALSKVRPLERLIVMNLPHPARIVRAAGGRQLLRSWYVFFFQIPRLPEALLGRRRARFIGDAFRRSVGDPNAFPEDAIEVFRENASQPGALTAMINWYRAAFRHRSDLRTLVEATSLLDVPTLMVWGEKDPALGVELTTGTERLVRDFTIRYLPVSHWVQQEAPDEVNAILDAWLTGQPVPGSPVPTTGKGPDARQDREASNESTTGGTST